MNAKKCDRCGKCFEKNVVNGLVLQKARFPFPNADIDLCKQCSDELQKLFEKPKKERENK